MKYKILLSLLLLMSLQLHAWPWPSPQGTIGLYTEVGYQSSDKKFSNGLLSEYDKGDAQPYFPGLSGTHTTLTTYGSISYMVLSNLQINLATQWSSVTWDRTLKTDDSGFKEISGTVSYFTTLKVPLKFFAGWNYPNSNAHSDNLNEISISDNIQTPFFGVSTGHVLPYSIYLYTTQSLQQPLQYTYTTLGFTNSIDKPLSWKNDISIIYPILPPWELTLNYSAAIPLGKTEAIEFGQSYRDLEYSYHTLTLGVGHSLGPGKVGVSIAKPIAGVEVPTGLIYKLSFGMNL
ncbi:MAG: hypothetical protein OCC49_18630 [Fibrobacterales bacterium]